MDRVSHLAARRRGLPRADAPSHPLAGLPEESPLRMPAQSLRQAPDGTVRWPPSSPPNVAWQRLTVLGGAMLLTRAATFEMSKVLDGRVLEGSWLSVPAVILLALFAPLFAWIALAFINAIVGFAVLMRRRTHLLLEDDVGQALTTRTALLVPIHNEQPAAVFGAIEAMYHSIIEADAGVRFDFFVLSDTTNPDAWIAEEAQFMSIRQRLSGGPGIYYRRRADNVGRKVGNVADWITRFGGAYAHLVVLDADSVMDGHALVRLAGAMERHQDVGLIQTLPISVDGQTVLARMQQFAGRIHGVLVAAGAIWWQGAEGNYYGHNAIIRTVAFAAAAGLPHLAGGKPFGGHILSHDFVEAALLRRAGWAVHTVVMPGGSYERGPPTLIDSAIRDRRWCQGNLQHLAVLGAAGLHPMSRLHLLTGIGAYLTAPLWLAFLIGGIILSVEAHLAGHAYFPQGHALFPHWPVVDPVRAKWMFFATMLMLIVPKLLAAAAFLRGPHDRRLSGGAGRVWAGVCVEIVVSGLLAPISMLTHAKHVVSIMLGRDAGWTAQRRDSRRVTWREAATCYWGHTLLGMALALVILITPALALWMSPVIIGLLLAIPLVVITSDVTVGQALARTGFLVIPEEAQPPRVLTRAAAHRARLHALDDDCGEGVSRLTNDTRLMALHLRLLPPARRPGHAPVDLKRATGLAKVRSVDELESALRLLDNEESLAALVAIAGRKDACERAISVTAG